MCCLSIGINAISLGGSGTCNVLGVLAHLSHAVSVLKPTSSVQGVQAHAMCWECLPPSHVLSQCWNQCCQFGGFRHMQCVGGACPPLTCCLGVETNVISLGGSGTCDVLGVLAPLSCVVSVLESMLSVRGVQAHAMCWRCLPPSRVLSQH